MDGSCSVIFQQNNNYFTAISYTISVTYVACVAPVCEMVPLSLNCDYPLIQGQQQCDLLHWITTEMFSFFREQKIYMNNKSTLIITTQVIGKE